MGSAASCCASGSSRSADYLRPQPALALAEACWLSWAVRIRQAGLTGTGPAHGQDVVILDRRPHEPLGSLREEVAFLTAVDRAWRSSAVRDFLAGLESRHHLA